MAFNIGPRIGVEGEKELKEALKAIIAEFKTLDAQMKAMETAFKRGEKSQKAYTEYQEKNAKAMETLSRLTEEYSKWVDIASSKHGESSSAAERYRTEIAKVGEEQEKLKTRAKDAADAEEEFAKDTDSAAEALSALETALVAAGLTQGLQNIKDLLRDCSDAAKEFETGMAAVSRTTGLEGSGLDSMAALLKELSTEIPITTTELANIASTAGQLGIETKYLEAFVTVMAQLGTATEMSSEQAATLLAQLANVTGTKEYDRLGSTMAFLGDATAASTTQIVEMSQRMAAAASIAGMTESDIAGIAASVASLGIESQAGGTAMSTLIQNLYKAVSSGGADLQKFADVAGMTAGEFKKAWGEDAAGAFTAFISGLNDASDEGKNAITVLEELGITNIRQRTAILGLSESEEALAQNISLASRAWEENTALGEKASKMYDTTEAKFTKFENSVNNLKIAIGDDLNPALADLADSGADAADWAADFVESTPGVVAGLTGLGAAMGTFAIGVTGAATAIKAISAIGTVLGAAGGTVTMLAGIGAALAGVVTTLTIIANDTDTAIGRMRELSKEVESTREEYEENIGTIESNYNSYRDLLGILGELTAKEERSAGEKQLLKKTVDELNAVLPDLALNYDETTDSLTGLADGTEITADSIEEMLDAMERQEKLDKNLDRALELRRQMAEAEEKLAAAKEKVAEAEENNLHKIPSTRDAYAGLINEVLNYEAVLASLSGEYDTLISETERLGQTSGTTSEALTGELAEIETAISEFDLFLQEAQKAYDEYYAEIRASLESLGGPLDELKKKTDVTFDSMVKTLKNNLAYWEEYNSNQEHLLNRNIDGVDKFYEDLVNIYGVGSEELAAILAALRTASDEEILYMKDDLLGTTSEIKDGISADFAEAKTDAVTETEEFVRKVKNSLNTLNRSGDMWNAAVNSVNGYINGLNAKRGAVYSAAYSLARQAVAGFAAGQNANSPAKEFVEQGGYSIDGYILGASEKEKKMRQTMMSLAQRAVAAFGAPALGGDGFTPFSADGVYDRMGGSLAGGIASTTTNNKTINLGGITLTVNAAAGQSAQDIAEAVMDAIQAEVERKGAVFA